MIPNDPLQPKYGDFPGERFIRGATLSKAAFWVYIAPLLLGATLPGEKITDPGGWLIGFWRYPFVALIVISQLLCFGYGLHRSLSTTTKILAAIYIVLMGFWLGRDYFFGVEVNWRLCAQCFILCLGITLLFDGVSIRRLEIQAWQRSRRD